MTNNTTAFTKQHVGQYDIRDWHRSLYDVKGSLLREIFYRVIGCTLVSVAVVMVNYYCYAPYGNSLGINTLAHTVVGTFLSLLLVFRTNASYDRFWEGRKQWGNIINESRNLARMCSVMLKDDPALLRRILRWNMAMPWTIMSVLHETKELGSVKEALPPEEVDEVMRSAHLPLAVARKISGLLLEAKQKGLISDYQQMMMDQNVQLLIDYCGACERIHKTPLPFAYVAHLRRGLIIYVNTLPFALLSTFKWETIPATFLIAYILFGIEEIGVEIEDPFGDDPNDLPLGLYCHGIQKVVQDVLDKTTPLDVHADKPAEKVASAG